MPAFWHWFVAAGTIVFVIWCVWLISWSAKQGPQNVADDDLVGHKWDGDLEEWNNPAPKWWLYLYFITIAWAIGYMVAYPGLGSYKGMLGWSQEGQYEAEMQAAAETLRADLRRVRGHGFRRAVAECRSAGARQEPVCELLHDLSRLGCARRAGYPNLTDGDWQWGNTRSELLTINRQGPQGGHAGTGPGARRRRRHRQHGQVRQEPVRLAKLTPER